MKLLFSSFKPALFALLLLMCGVQTYAQYPAIPGSPTTLENSNTPDPFYGDFKNGGSVTYSIDAAFESPSASAIRNAAFCIDRATPVCDGTKNPLSLGSANTDAKLAYALFLANRVGLSTSAGNDIGRNLIWAVMGQTNTCSSNTTCNELYNDVQLYNSSSTFNYSFSVSPEPSGGYKVGDKVIFTVTTNMSRFKYPGVGINSLASWTLPTMEFCDASGNPISQPSSVAPIGTTTLQYSGGMMQNLNAPNATTIYLCVTLRETGSYIMHSFLDWDNFSFGAGDATIWNGSNCQSLAHIMPVPLKSPVYLNVTCDALSDVIPTVSNATPSAYGFVDFGVTATGTGSTTTYEWEGPNNFQSTDQNPTYIEVPGSAGTHTYTVNVSNGGTCSATATVTVYIAGPCTPFGTLTGTASPASVSPSSATTLSVSGSGVQDGTTYSWAGPNSYASTSASPYVTVPSSVGVYTYTVTVQNIGTNTCTASTTVQVTVAAGNANLSLQKTVSKLNPNSGESITYTVKITNAGPQAATNVVLKDQLPTGLTYGSVSAGTYVPATGLWTIGAVPVGTTTVTMTVTVN